MITPVARVSLVKNFVRYAHSSAPAPKGQIQDVESFFKIIGRECGDLASKFESWDQLFTTSTRVMKTDMGIPTKQRKYILGWLEKYRQGAQPYAISLPKPKKK
ncbi:hypothetical protein K501DRAFT_251633, partial [Backusella circina FSU 941]